MERKIQYGVVVNFQENRIIDVMKLGGSDSNVRSSRLTEVKVIAAEESKDLAGSMVGIPVLRHIHVDPKSAKYGWRQGADER